VNDMPLIPDPARPVGRIPKVDVIEDLTDRADSVKPGFRARLQDAIVDGRIPEDEQDHLLEMIDRANGLLRRAIQIVENDWIENPTPHYIKFPDDTIVIPGGAE